jgi:hypothetical protein
MNEEILNAATERFPNLTEAEQRMLRAERSEFANCGSDNDDSNPANNPEYGESWGIERTIHADVIWWLCRNAETFGRTASSGIAVSGAKIVDDLDLSYEDVRLPLVFMRCYFKNEIWLKNAKVLSLNLTGCRTHRILADGLQAASHVWFGNGFHAKGEVLFRDANIGGSFNVVGAIFEYDPTDDRSNSFNSLGCDRIKVNGSMFLRGSSFKGEVGLAGAFIGSNLDCDGGTFENLFDAQDGNRFAIRADRITVGGSVFLRHQFSSKGSIRLLNAKIGTLDCTRATIEGDGKNGFNAEAATISGHAVFDNFAIQNGGIEFRGVTADDASFRGAKLTTVDLRYATIRRALRIKQIIDVNQSLWDLRNASVGSVDDDKESWPLPGRFFIDGFTYQGFGSVSVEPPEESSKVPLDFKSRKQWVELDPSHPPHAYRQLASVYSRIGDTAKSRAALFALEDLLHCNGIEEEDSVFLRFIKRAWMFLLKVTIGYGYRLGRAGWWLALFLLVGFAFSCLGYSAHLIVPTDKDAYAFFAQPQHWYPPNSYPVFHATMFSIENGIPAINLSMSDHWRVAGCLNWWFFVERIVGWFLSIFFVAGITGLAKSEK